MTLYFVNVLIHVMAALLWLGGMFFLAVVGAPVLRKIEDPVLRARLFRALGEQFRLVGWVCIILLLVTGFGNLYFRGFLSGAVLLSGDFWATRYGTTLAWKLIAVAVMLVVQSVHDFWLGPRAGTVQPGSEEALRLRRWAALGARVNALVGVIVVIAAVRLARGG